MLKIEYFYWLSQLKLKYDNSVNTNYLLKRNLTITFINYFALELVNTKRIRKSALLLLAQRIAIPKDKMQKLGNKLNEKQITFKFVASE